MIICYKDHPLLILKIVKNGQNLMVIFPKTFENQ